MPIHWGKNQPGMQAYEECNNPITSRMLGGGYGDNLDTYSRERWWWELAEHRITSYNVCYTKLLRDIGRNTLNVRNN